MKTEKIINFYKSTFNKAMEKQVKLLMINDDKKQHYLAVKNLNSPFLKNRDVIVENAV